VKSCCRWGLIWTSALWACCWIGADFPPFEEFLLSAHHLIAPRFQTCTPTWQVGGLAGSLSRAALWTWAAGRWVGARSGTTLAARYTVLYAIMLILICLPFAKYLEVMVTFLCYQITLFQHLCWAVFLPPAVKWCTAKLRFRSFYFQLNKNTQLISFFLSFKKTLSELKLKYQWRHKKCKSKQIYFNHN